MRKEVQWTVMKKYVDIKKSGYNFDPHKVIHPWKMHEEGCRRDESRIGGLDHVCPLTLVERIKVIIICEREVFFLSTHDAVFPTEKKASS